MVLVLIDTHYQKTHFDSFKNQKVSFLSFLRFPKSNQIFDTFGEKTSKKASNLVRKRTHLFFDTLEWLIEVFLKMSQMLKMLQNDNAMF